MATPAVSLLDRLVGTVGPFLLPILIFVVGVAFYLLLYYLGKTDLEE